MTNISALGSCCLKMARATGWTLIVELLLILLVANVGARPSENAKEAAEKLERMKKECSEESGFKMDEKALNFTTAPREAKCYFSCMLQKSNTLQTDGTFNFDEGRKELKADPTFSEEVKNVYYKTFDECPKEIEIKPDDLCETAMNFMLCEMNKLDEFFKTKSSNSQQ